MKPVHSAAASNRSQLRGLDGGRPRARAVLAAFVGALVVGILGMHALATHGSTPSSTVAASSMAMTHASAHAAAMSAGDSAGDGHAASGAESGTGSAAHHDALSFSAHTDTGSGHDTGTMVMLCVVMLAAAALTLLALLAVRVVRPLLPMTFHPAVVLARAAQWVRGTGPPHVWAFSVIRC